MNTLKNPYAHNLKQIYGLSLVCAVMMVALSLAGIIFQHSIYVTEELRRTFLANDVVNLVVGLPMLVFSMGLAWRGRLIGLLLWPGALFYIVYNYIAYTFALWPAVWSFLYILLAVLSVYSITVLFSRLDSSVIRQQLDGQMLERWVAGVLVGLGVLFFLRGAGIVVNDLTSQELLSRVGLSTTIADLLTTPVWVIGGIQLWRRWLFGYVSGLGLLFQASTLFIGLILFMILQPFLTSAPFVLSDVLVIFAMGLICFIPFGLAVCKAVRSDWIVG